MQISCLAPDQNQRCSQSARVSMYGLGTLLKRPVAPYANPPLIVYALLLLLLHSQVLPAAPSPKMPVVSKWGRFEHAFKSSKAYTHPLQEATLTVTFTSPLGETSQA